MTSRPLYVFTRLKVDFSEYASIESFRCARIATVVDCTRDQMIRILYSIFLSPQTPFRTTRRVSVLVTALLLLLLPQTYVCVCNESPRDVRDKRNDDGLATMSVRKINCFRDDGNVPLTHARLVAGRISTAT